MRVRLCDAATAAWGDTRETARSVFSVSTGMQQLLTSSELHTLLSPNTSGLAYELRVREGGLALLNIPNRQNIQNRVTFQTDKTEPTNK
jgi:hypothetical protein